MAKAKINIVRGKDITPINYIDSGQINEITKNGLKFHEYPMLEAIAGLNLGGELFIDIGAHVGNHSIFFAKYCGAQVISYEADISTYFVLVDNIRSNQLGGKIVAINKAIGNENRDCLLQHNEKRPGQSRVIKAPGNLTMTTLAHVTGEVALIKIDVEGKELEVVEGCMSVIRKDSPELFIETFGDYKKVLELLPDGYRMIKRYNNAPTYHFSTKKQ